MLKGICGSTLITIWALSADVTKQPSSEMSRYRLRGEALWITDTLEFFFRRQCRGLRSRGQMATRARHYHFVAKFACTGGVSLVAVLALSLMSCTTPDAVSKFCGAASTMLTSAAPIFADMEQSCLREVNSRAEIGTFKSPLQSDPNCTLIANQAAGATAAAILLSDYFNAINSLASFGAVKAGTDAQNLATKTGAAVGASSAAQTALRSIAQFLVSAATSGYQRKQLEKDLTKVSGNISAVVNALITIVRDDYVGRQLKSEEQKLADRYLEFAKDKSPEVKLMLDDRWHADEQALEAKRASAQSLIMALQVLSKGFADLAANAHHLKAKEVPDLLGPYVTQLQALIPQIQKAF